MRWNITLSSNSRSLRDKMPSTLPSLTQYGFISMTSYLISRFSETTHGQKLEHHCWLNWLDYGNVQNHFSHQTFWSFTPRVGWRWRSLKARPGASAQTLVATKRTVIPKKNNWSRGGCAVLHDKNARFSCTVELTFFTATQYLWAKRRLVPFYLPQLSVIWLDHTWAWCPVATA